MSFCCVIADVDATFKPFTIRGGFGGVEKF